MIGCLLMTYIFQAQAQVQWASEVIGVSSEFKNTSTPGSYGARQALGAPSTFPEGRDGSGSPCAWSPAVTNGPANEWIHLKFANPKPARQLVINENFNPGAIYKVWLYDPQGKEYLIFENPSPAPDTQKPAKLWQKTFPLTTYLVVSVKIELQTAAVDGYNHIDAVGISEKETPVEVTVHTSSAFVTTDKPENLGSYINSPTDELLPSITPDGKTLYFVRQGHAGNIGTPDMQDVWFSQIEKGVLTEAQNLGGPINNKENNALLTITPDGQKALLLNVYNADGTMGTGISMTTRQNSQWGMPKQAVVDSFYNRSAFGEYCLATSGDVLVMTLQRDNAVGNKDIYVSFAKSDGNWTVPRHLGPKVNTASSEISPFLAADGVTLYFATAGRPGYGKADMFVTRRLDDTWTNWTEPQNLGSVVNTSGFDAYYSIPASGEYAYFVSYTNSLGGADIFRIKLPVAMRPNPVVLIKGKVLDAVTNKPLAAEIFYEDLKTGLRVGKASSDAITGDYSIILPAGKNYGFRAETSGYVSVSENLDLTKLMAYKEIRKDLKLVPLQKGQVVRLNNLFFDFSKYSLRNESKSELTRLVELLKKNPTMKIQIQGHTDDVGQDADNLVLSQNRTKAVQNFLVKQGIAVTRIMATGYGETKPVLPNTSPENRQQNRRVEFLIVEL